MRSNLQNLYLKVFAIIVIILCTCPLHTIAQLVREFLHEEKDYGIKTPPRVAKIKTYDNIIAMRIIRRDISKSNKFVHCNYDTFFLRVIYPNATLIEKDIKLEGVPFFNYCSKNEVIEVIDYLRFEIIGEYKILIVYHNSTDNINVEGWGMVIDFDGKVFDRIPLGIWGHKNFKNNYKLNTPPMEISLNIKREKGFIVAYRPKGSNLVWKQYKMELDGKLTSLTSGTIELGPNAISKISSLISTVDENYSFIYKLNNTSPKSILQDQIITELIGYNKSDTTKVYLCQTNLLNKLPQPLSCNIEYAGVGHSCSMPVRDNQTNLNLKIGFLSSGATISLNVTNINFPDNNIKFGTWRLRSLIFGGYLLTIPKKINNTDFGLYIYIYTDDGVLYNTEPLETNIYYAYTVLPNNTLLFAPMEYNNTWGYKIFNLPELTNDNGYFNTNIDSTFPATGSLISSTYPDITNVSIDFKYPVTLSNGTLSIFQIEGEEKFLRQSTSGTKCILDNGDKRVIINILGSTFSKSGGNYFIKVDNNFVKSRIYGEPLIGIRDGVWNFVIEDKKYSYTITSSASGLLRLTVDGTNIIKNSSDDEKNQFFNTLLDGLAEAVQISRNRLSINSKIQMDPRSNDDKLLVNINIDETKNPYEKDVNSVIQDINDMMSNNDQTLIGYEKLSNLDFTYGFKPAPNYWQEYGPKLLVLLLIIILLIIIYVLAKKREKKGQNIVIFIFFFFIFDFVMDTLFIINNAKDVKKLYIPSLIFYTVPIGLNIVSAFLIIFKENARKEFLLWFTENNKITSIFTVLAGIDIGILNILHSNFAGFENFQAPFSDSTKSMIFWIASLNIFIEDIPQFVIQILFRTRSITYDIIPIFNLISSAITLAINIISRLYQSINYIRDRNLRTAPIIGHDDSK